MHYSQYKKKGFSLIEMVLVLAIISSMVAMYLRLTTRQSEESRRDRVVMQMQQLMTAASNYYIDNGKWPFTDVSTNSLGPGCNPNPLFNVSGRVLVSSYLPQSQINPYNQPQDCCCLGLTGDTTVSCGSYQLECFKPGGPFYIATKVNTATNALAIAGRLPMAFVTDQNGWNTNPIIQSAQCTSPSNASFNNCVYVVAIQSVPAQVSNNARSVNFANLYHHGACVPVPTCIGSMTPQVMLAPVSVSGVNDAGSPTIYPLTGFTAYAKGGNDATPPACNGSSTPLSCAGLTSSTGFFWRACMQVITENGEVSTTNLGTGANMWGKDATILAITRCAPPNEPPGSGPGVFSN